MSGRCVVESGGREGTLSPLPPLSPGPAMAACYGCRAAISGCIALVDHRFGQQDSRCKMVRGVG